MKKTIEHIAIEVEKLKANAAADLAFIRCAIFTLSTANLEATQATMLTLSESMTTSMLYTPNASDVENNAFSERISFWLSALNDEMQARNR